MQELTRFRNVEILLMIFTNEYRNLVQIASFL